LQTTGTSRYDRGFDQFTVVTINSIAQGKTLVALLVDQSRSIAYGDLPHIVARTDHYFDEVDKNLPSRLLDNGRWVVVAYGRTARFKCKPSNDLVYVKAALGDVEVDASGTEDLGRAVNLVLDQYGGTNEYKTILIAAMTDESGDDVKDPRLLEDLIRRMRNSRAEFFTLGKEGTFCAQRRRVTMTLDPEIMCARDRDAIRGFEGRTIEGWANGGPESPRPELWWGEDWQQWQQWGGVVNDIPSGFGMYEMNRMCLSTGGVYFLLKLESRYDEETDYAKYKPDICSRFDYDKRMDEVPLRTELRAIWSEMGRFYLPYDLRTAEQVQQQLEGSARAREYCIKAAKRLQQLLTESKPVGDNWARWEAHAHLTVAELVRLHFMLGQYHDALKQTFGQNDHAVPEGRRYVLVRGKAPDDFVGLQAARDEYDRALRYIDIVVEKHRDTPWDLAAQRLRYNVFPWKCDVIDLPKPDCRPAPPPVPF